MTRIYVHPVPVRIWHWINAVGFVVLIVTGLQIRYGVLAGMAFKTIVDVHNATGFVLIADYFHCLGFYLLSDKITVDQPDFNPTRHFRNVMRQLAYYRNGIFKGHPNPHHVSAYRKFNALQSMMYQIIMMIVVPVQFATGVLLWDVARFSGAVEALGGVRVVDTVHVLIFIFFAGFMVVHVYLASLGHTTLAHFKAMINGNGSSPRRRSNPTSAPMGSRG